MNVKSRFYCSFCGKHRTYVQKLILGQNGSICDECISRCVAQLQLDHTQAYNRGETSHVPLFIQRHRELDKLTVAEIMGQSSTDGVTLAKIFEQYRPRRLNEVAPIIPHLASSDDFHAIERATLTRVTESPPYREGMQDFLTPEAREELAARKLAMQHDLSFRDVGREAIEETSVYQRLPRAFCEQHTLVAVDLNHTFDPPRLVVAMVDPKNMVAFNAMSDTHGFGLEIEIVVATKSGILATIERCYGPKEMPPELH